MSEALLSVSDLSIGIDGKRLVRGISFSIQILSSSIKTSSFSEDFEEGDSAEIQQINIVGNSVYSDAELLANFELKDKLPWWNFLGARTSQKQQFQASCE